MSDSQDIRAEIAQLRVDMQANTKLTQDGFDKVNGRIKSIEYKQAFQEGASSVNKTTGDDDWRKATFKLIGLIAAIVALASTAAGIVASVVLK